jgi:hypothetical protein
VRESVVGEPGNSISETPTLDPQNNQIWRLDGAPRPIVSRGGSDASRKLKTRGSQKVQWHVKTREWGEDYVQGCPAVSVERGSSEVVQIGRRAVTRSQRAHPQHAGDGLHRGRGVLVSDGNERIRGNAHADRTAVGEEDLVDLVEERRVFQRDQELDGGAAVRLFREVPSNVSPVKRCRIVSPKEARFFFFFFYQWIARSKKVSGAFSGRVNGAPLKRDCGAPHTPKVGRDGEHEDGFEQQGRHDALRRV